MSPSCCGDLLGVSSVAFLSWSSNSLLSCLTTCQIVEEPWDPHRLSNWLGFGQWIQKLLAGSRQTDGHMQCSCAGLISLQGRLWKRKKRMTDVSGAEQESMGSSVKHLKKAFQTWEATEGKCALAFSASYTGTRAEQNSEENLLYSLFLCCS